MGVIHLEGGWGKTLSQTVQRAENGNFYNGTQMGVIHLEGEEQR